MRHHLPILDERILDDVGVAAPCDADWNAMKGDVRVRHCPSCRQNVYNLSAMSRREAVDLIAEREGSVCIRMLRRADGTLVTRDCRELLRRARQRGLLAYAVALVLVLAVNVGLRALGAYALWSWWEERQAPIMMGEPAPPAPPVPIMGGPVQAPMVEVARYKKMGKMAVRPRVTLGCDPNSDPLCGIE